MAEMGFAWADIFSHRRSPGSPTVKFYANSEAKPKRNSREKEKRGEKLKGYPKIFYRELRGNREERRGE